MEEKRKIPVLLLVLAILSFISMTFSFGSAAYNLMTGPASKQEVKMQQAELLKPIAELKSAGADWMVKEVKKTANLVEGMRAFHTEISLFSLLTVILGIVSVILMLKRNSLGFHGYIIYSLLSSTQLYFFFSVDQIPLITITVMLILSAIFVVLYGLNLKWMKS